MEAAGKGVGAGPWVMFEFPVWALKSGLVPFPSGLKM